MADIAVYDSRLVPGLGGTTVGLRSGTIAPGCAGAFC